jgi:uncharacterized protein
MLADDLSAPLGQHKTQPRRAAGPMALPYVIVGTLSLVVVAVAGWAMIVDDPIGGEPMVIVPANLRADTAVTKPKEVSLRSPAPGITEPPKHDGQPAGAGEPTAPVIPPGSKIITIIDGMSGKRQDIVIPGPP